MYMWAKTNQVRGDNPTGLPHHSFGAEVGSDIKMAKKTDEDVHKYTYHVSC